MEELSILNKYNLILIRYNEIWLKSRRVKARMLTVLMNNIKNRLKYSKIHFHKYQLSSDSSRILFFFDNKDLSDAVEVIRDAFGVHSLSPALRTSNSMKNITERTLEVAQQIFTKGDSFALKVTRSGQHEFSSKDVAIQVGQAIKDNFVELKLKVNLTNPEKVIYIEVREEFAYIFTQVMNSNWGGLPIEGNKKVLVMDIGRLNDILSGFLIMRRGSVMYPLIFDLRGDYKLIEQYLENWKMIVKYIPSEKFKVRIVNVSDVLKKINADLMEKKYMCALCRCIRFEIAGRILKDTSYDELGRVKAITDGASLNNETLCSDEVDLETLSLNYMFFGQPIFTSVIGLEVNEIDQLHHRVSKDFKSLDYCPFLPKNQEFNSEEVVKRYRELNLNADLEKCVSNLKIINLK